MKPCCVQWKKQWVATIKDNLGHKLNLQYFRLYVKLKLWSQELLSHSGNVLQRRFTKFSLCGA